MNKYAVILLSGGIDSTACLYYARQRFNLSALIFDYGQRHRKEIDAARSIAGRLHIPYRVVTLDLHWVTSALTSKSMPVPKKRNLLAQGIPTTYVPGRNILFLSYAVSFADNFNYRDIFIGAHTQDYSGYPDCRGEFISAFEKAVNRGIKNRVTIHAPFLKMGKSEIIKIGLRLKVPFHLTWSCYEGGKTPCLTCDSCRYRIEGFRKLGMEDPLLKK